MTKEIEEIRDDKLRIGLLGLKRIVEANAKKMTKDEIMAFDFTFMNITKALLELQAIKEAKPSEALKIVDDIVIVFEEMLKVSNQAREIMGEKPVYVDFNEIGDIKKLRQALLKAEKLEKAIKIIKEKKVDMFNLKVAIDNNSLRLYNNTISKAFKHLKLTQQGFELLKERLKIE